MLLMVTDVVASASLDVAAEAFDLGIEILEGGNIAVQNSLLSYFINHEERFFHDMEDMIQDAIRHGRDQRTRSANSFYYQVCDTRLEFPNIQKAFRFLQLLCEGHHLPLQDYLRS
eukprot:Tbor_TRINITY_DN10204_c0_g1::TRINITY_DN10204_c0_g1_i1::g.5354::m.5354